jgi:hypothetical protein
MLEITKDTIAEVERDWSEGRLSNWGQAQTLIEAHQPHDSFREGDECREVEIEEQSDQEADESEPGQENVEDGNENADIAMDALEDTQSDAEVVVQPCHQETDETKSPEQLTRQERFPQAPPVHPQSPAHEAQDDYMEFDVPVRVIDVCTKDLGGGCYVIGIRTAGQGMKRAADSLPGTPRERPAGNIGSPASLLRTFPGTAIARRA